MELLKAKQLPCKESKVQTNNLTNELKVVSHIISIILQKNVIKYVLENIHSTDEKQKIQQQKSNWLIQLIIFKGDSN